MSKYDESFETTWQRCCYNGIFALGRYLRVLAECEVTLETLKRPERIDLMERRIQYIKMQRLMNESL